MRLGYAAVGVLAELAEPAAQIRSRGRGRILPAAGVTKSSGQGLVVSGQLLYASCEPGSINCWLDVWAELRKALLAGRLRCLCRKVRSRLAWWPADWAAAQQVDVEMVDGLAAVGAGVEDYAIAVGEAFGAGDLGCRPEEMA